MIFGVPWDCWRNLSRKIALNPPVLCQLSACIAIFPKDSSLVSQFYFMGMFELFHVYIYTKWFIESTFLNCRFLPVLIYCHITIMQSYIIVLQTPLFNFPDYNYYYSLLSSNRLHVILYDNYVLVNMSALYLLSPFISNIIGYNFTSTSTRHAHL